MKDQKSDIVTEHSGGYRNNRLTLGGVLAFSLLATVQLLFRDDLSISAQFAVFCFALAIPLLGVNISLLSLELDYKKSCRPWYIWWSSGIGILAGLLGTAATFFVFHAWAGILFVVASVASAVVMYDFIGRIQKLNPQDFETDESEQHGGQVSSEAAPNASPDKPSA